MVVPDSGDETGMEGEASTGCGRCEHVLQRRVGAAMLSMLFQCLIASAKSCAAFGLLTLVGCLCRL
jgi:hypothetical protein